MDDTISRAAALDELIKMLVDCFQADEELVDAAVTTIKDLPSAQPAPLTDKEQRIFLAAMAREEMICEEVDRNYVREPYEDSLVRICKDIRRKVKGALWT